MNIPSCGGHGTFGSLGSIYTFPVALMNNDELGWLTSTFGSFHGKKCTIFEEFIFFNVPFSVVVNYRYHRGTWEKNSMVTNTTFRILRNWCGDTLATSTRNQQVGFYHGQIPRFHQPKGYFSALNLIALWSPQLKFKVTSSQCTIINSWKMANSILFHRTLSQLFMDTVKKCTRKIRKDETRHHILAPKIRI